MTFSLKDEAAEALSSTEEIEKTREFANDFCTEFFVGEHRDEFKKLLSGDDAEKNKRFQESLNGLGYDRVCSLTRRLVTEMEEAAKSGATVTKEELDKTHNFLLHLCGAIERLEEEHPEYFSSLILQR